MYLPAEAATAMRRVIHHPHDPELPQHGIRYYAILAGAVLLLGSAYVFMQFA